jgi:hypothetical protein
MSRIRTRIEREREARERDAAIARALLEAEPAAARIETPRSRLDEEMLLLRGIPVIGVQGGKGGAMSGTKPGQRLRGL